ncbi:MAG: autotransporter domain-containing protein [Asticcacaulis sp.]
MARKLAHLLTGSALGLTMAATLAGAAGAVVVPAGQNPNDYIDTTNTRPYWVGLGIRNAAGTGGGICTGMLINPRTVLFAAHCVDDSPMSVYNAPGSRAAVGYTQNPTFGTSGLSNWLFNPAAGNTMANSVAVFYHPDALLNESNGGPGNAFLSADVAYAAFGSAVDLGRNASNTAGLLFSPVTSKVNVVMGGYGQTGTATGTHSTNFQRRLGTNILGFLGSERDINLVVYPGKDPFGGNIVDFFSPPGSSYQDLYWTDFDDPQRTAPNNFNVLVDNATSKEISTAPGDSGSPLITGDFSLAGTSTKRDVSLGVLSQGTNIFAGSNTPPYFQSAGFARYGSLAGYNPLFLFWDFLVVNNPYKYVSAKAGDREWSDATTWVQDIDPVYYTLNASGQLVNSLPTTPALGVSTAATNVGTLQAPPLPLPGCALVGCRTNPFATGGEPGASIGGGSLDLINQAMPDKLTASGFSTTSDAGPAQAATAITKGSQNVAFGATANGPWPVAVGNTPLSGPGSTNFVPNNTPGTSGVFNSSRYFEVTLSNEGRLSLTNVTATIDRLNVSNSRAELNIKAGSTLNTTLTSYLDAGILNVNGTLAVGRVAGESPANARLDLLGGFLTGNGTVSANVQNTGAIVSAGTAGSVGALTINGNFTSGVAGVLGVDLGSATSFDRLTVAQNATIAGTLAVSSAPGFRPVYGQTFSNVIATGGTLTGSFGIIADNIPGVLRPEAVYSAKGMDLRMAAASYSGFINSSSKAQTAAGMLFDGSRSQSGLNPIYAELDLLSGEALHNGLESLTPSGAFGADNALRSTHQVNHSTFTNRPFAAGNRSGGGAMARKGSAATLLADGSDLMGGMSDARYITSANDAGKGGMALSDDVSAFVNAGYIKGNGTLNGYTTGLSRQDVKGWNLGGGIERHFGMWSIGAGGSLSSTDVEQGALSKVESQEWQLHAFGGFVGAGKNRFYLDWRFGLGKVDVDSSRTAMVGNTAYRLSGKTDGTVTSVDVNVGYVMPLGDLEMTPYAAYTGSKAEMDGYTETGGAAALKVNDRTFESRQTRLGLRSSGELKNKSGWTIRPNLGLAVVREAHTKASVSASFAAAPTNVLLINAIGSDSDWYEAQVGVRMEKGQNTIDLAIEKDLGRKDLDLTAISAAWRFKF